MSNMDDDGECVNDDYISLEKQKNDYISILNETHNPWRLQVVSPMQ